MTTATGMRWARLGLARSGVGPLLALAVAGVAFSVTTATFFTADNLSLLLDQSVVVGLLAVGQTLIILTGGIDLANGAIAVVGTIIMARHAPGQGAAVSLLAALTVCTALGTASGSLVARLRLPPFIVTLGMLAVVAASGRLYSQSRSYPVDAALLVVSGRQLPLGPFALSYGVLGLLLVYAALWYVLRQTAWGRHVYAIGGNQEAARLMGIPVNRTLLSVYAGAGLLYGLAAWAALGRIPNADANAYQTANLDSITAVVIGGTSLFGGRGGVMGSLLGTLLVSVLRSGLTQAGIDALYQDVGTGILVVAAVAVDQMARRGQK
ncbi:MAG: ABC transporter permease [Myxococcales bacterium]